MKRRLRKKLERREFQKTGFSMGLVLQLIEKDSDSPAYFWNRLTDFVEDNGLYLLGGGDVGDNDTQLLDVNVFTKYDLVPVPAIKESDRYLLRDWLRQQPEKKYIIGPRTQGWHFYYHQATDLAAIIFSNYSASITNFVYLSSTNAPGGALPK